VSAQLEIELTHRRYSAGLCSLSLTEVPRRLAARIGSASARIGRRLSRGLLATARAAQPCSDSAAGIGVSAVRLRSLAFSCRALAVVSKLNRLRDCLVLCPRGLDDVYRSRRLPRYCSSECILFEKAAPGGKLKRELVSLSYHNGRPIRLTTPQGFSACPVEVPRQIFDHCVANKIIEQDGPEDSNGRILFRLTQAGRSRADLARCKDHDRHALP
jgi:hypothetical protein